MFNKNNLFHNLRSFPPSGDRGLKILIIGGGFGGLKLARELNNKAGFEIYLLDKYLSFPSGDRELIFFARLLKAAV